MIIVDITAFIFWWIVFRSYQLVCYLAVLPIPDSIIKKIVCRHLAKYRIKVTTDYGGVVDSYPVKDYAIEMVVHSPQFFKRIAWDDNMGFFDGYMNGWWDCDDVPELVDRLLDQGCTLNRHLSARLLCAKNQQTKVLSLRVAEEHYNLGNDLYQKMLDPTMNYTCAYWKPDTKTLEEAQINKMDLIAQKLKLKPGMKVLDIGSGFGATAKYLAEKYNVSVTGYNISKEQLAFARENCKGLDVTFIEDDYRNASGKYDRIYSIGFFEAVGSHNFREYFEVVERCLKDDGLTLLHTITVCDSFPRTGRWVCKYIFPGGELPFVSELATVCKGLFVVEDVHSFAKSYKKTLVEWLKNFETHWKELEPKYVGLVDGRFKRMWEMYLYSCIGFFEHRTIQLHQVVYSKFGRKEEYKSVRYND